MRVYLVRHAPAQEAAAWEGHDSERPLTDDGLKRARAVAKRLKSVGACSDIVLTGPFARAMQTAAALASACNSNVLIDERLAAGASPHDYEAVLREHGSSESVIVVGHEPDLSSFVHHLTGARIVMRKAGIARIDTEGPRLSEAWLVWLAPPSLLLD